MKKILQGNDVLELIRNRGARKRQDFALKTLVLHAIYICAVLAIAITVGVRGVMLLNGGLTSDAVLLFAIAAVDLAVAAWSFCRRAQFAVILGRLICNVAVGVTAVIWIFAGEGALVGAVVHLALWVILWAVTAIGRYLTVSYSRIKDEGKDTVV